MIRYFTFPIHFYQCTFSHEHDDNNNCILFGIVVYMLMTSLFGSYLYFSPMPSVYGLGIDLKIVIFCSVLINQNAITPKMKS